MLTVKAKKQNVTPKLVQILDSGDWVKETLIVENWFGFEI
jgi:hypothetical protein